MAVGGNAGKSIRTAALQARVSLDRGAACGRKTVASRERGSPLGVFFFWFFMANRLTASPIRRLCADRNQQAVCGVSESALSQNSYCNTVLAFDSPKTQHRRAATLGLWMYR